MVFYWHLSQKPPAPFTIGELLEMVPLGLNSFTAFPAGMEYVNDSAIAKYVQELDANNLSQYATYVLRELSFPLFFLLFFLPYPFPHDIATILCVQKAMHFICAECALLCFSLLQLQPSFWSNKFDQPVLLIFLYFC